MTGRRSTSPRGAPASAPLVWLARRRGVSAPPAVLMPALTRSSKLVDLEDATGPVAETRAGPEEDTHGLGCAEAPPGRRVGRGGRRAQHDVGRIARGLIDWLQRRLPLKGCRAGWGNSSHPTLRMPRPGARRQRKAHCPCPPGRLRQPRTLAGLCPAGAQPNLPHSKRTPVAERPPSGSQKRSVVSIPQSSCRLRL